MTPRTDRMAITAEISYSAVDKTLKEARELETDLREARELLELLMFYVLEGNTRKEQSRAFLARMDKIDHPEGP